MREESPEEVKRIIYLSTFAGAASTSLVALLNEAAGKVSNSKSVTPEFFLFIVCLLLFLFIIRKSSRATVLGAQTIIHRFKMRIMKDILLSNMQTLEKVGNPEIMEALGKSSQAVSQSIPVLVMVGQSVATLTFLSLYMATISLIACFVIISAVIILFFASAKFIFLVKDELHAAWAKEASLGNLFGDYLTGFKEIKMNSERAHDITLEVVEASRETTAAKSEALIKLSLFFNFLQVLLYLIIALIIFVIPNMTSDFSSAVVPATTAAIFLVGSLTGIINGLPSLSEANEAAGLLLKLEEKLEIIDNPNQEESSQDFAEMRSIKLLDVMYRHKNSSKSFVVGPVSYEFNAGNIYFIKGNNGSGKTSLMRILLGLYEPDAGQIYVNEILVDQPVSQSYRDLFAVVFSDFFLFKKLYGIFSSSDEQIEHWLQIFNITDKVTIDGGMFSTLNLSTGQKKRVALIVAILENRPIIVLDEWAADQDPEFRKIFYTQILPLFRQMGKTVIAITHDDQYFDIADYSLTVKNGKLLEG